MTQAGKVLVVEDDAAVRDALAQTLELAGLTPVACASFVVAKDHIAPEFAGVVLSDIRMPGRDGFYLLDHVQAVDSDLPVILLTGEGDIPMAVRAMERGAFGFLEKPCAPADLLAALDRALKTRALVLENRALKSALQAGDPAARMIFGTSAKAEALREQVRQIARSGSDALVTGAAGTGISKIAEVIHLCSSAARAPFEKCAGRDLQRSALETAAATAAGGTLFIDAIDALPAQTAFALTEILDAKTDLRVIGGAAGLLEAQNALPADVFYHLSTAQAHVPALSERPEDIPVLFRHYVAQAAEQSGTPAPQIDPQTLAQLVAQDWPGNARALMSAAMRFVLGVGTAAGAETLAGGQAQGHAAAPAQGQSLSAQMAQVERSLLMAALERAGGQASVAAKDLSLPRKTFYDKLARYEIKPEDFRS